ncbi:MAG TPA: 2-oxoglutarate and iron-dependent oxygenase domain-containing protein [Geminicoccus sp.]|jgi:isopenicillin N synthase-like dioxygenase|uniref:isopenicillin N synthase family dioxygenase n=1 Tax=Geminicoccus sp. TaxID=2024832 RepID=UPI002E343BF3|nr:2-oxoglutarate and iron-dependent oxygenase domain-containing protein [Geminicoccus sp.]HEX2526707.1 2-oxoglutarate and iron-dependent oxygenase domain-containing protein [Geminicoccus sp.]
MASVNLPIVDASAKGGNLDRLAADIGKAARATGFFYLVGHGIPRDLTRSVFQQAAGFFAKDEQVKRMIAADRSMHGRGYLPFRAESLDPSGAGDLREAFTIGLELQEDHPEIAMGARLRGPNQWPEERAFRHTMLAYFWACWSLGRRLHQAIARDLAMPADFFEDKFDRPLATLRLFRYLPHPDGGAGGSIGAGEHTDPNVLTLLKTDGTDGLEIRRPDGSWQEVPHVPGAFVVNVGDCLMRWTNDTYVSAPHRVVNRNGADRYSLGYFLDPNPDASVAVLPTCVTPDRPARYAPITSAAYLAERQNNLGMLRRAC